MKTKRLNTELRQGQIKKTVLEIIASEGIGKLSTRNLASRINVSEGALFRHFPTKKAIILSIINDVKNELLEHQKEIVDSNLSPDRKLEKFLCSHIKYLLERNGITILLFSEAAHLNEPDLKNSLNNIFSKQKKYVKKIIKLGINEGIWDSDLKAENVAMLYMGIPVVLNVEIILNPKGISEKRFCKNMLCLLRRILKKQNG